jgi:N-formylglutamate deformylase
LGPEAASPGFVRQVGTTALIVSMPHVGTDLPQDIASQLTPAGLAVPDTDWHVERLFAFARAVGASWLQARYSRYVIDLNRPPDDQSLYPGQTTTPLCPAESFAGERLYHGATPSAGEIARRRSLYWLPYHAALRELIDTTHDRFGHAVLLEGHSIRSELPRLFSGRLPDVNVGTNDGRSCAVSLSARVVAVLAQQRRFLHVVNGRFKGGYITRAYGDPHAGTHALQLEIAQSAYMDETGSSYDADRARPLESVLRQIVSAMLEFDPHERAA